MEIEDLDFSFNMEGIDRQALLTQAAEEFTKLRGPLADTAPQRAETEESTLVRHLLEDQAAFADFPVVHKITDRSFLSQNVAVPIRFSELAREYNFYWLYFPFVLFPRHNWAFNRLEIQIKLIAGNSAPHLQPKAFQILPNMKYQTLVEANTGLQVRLDENAELEVKPIGLTTPLGGIGAGVSLKAAAEMGLVVGPFVYHIKRAKIQHTATGAERVFWRIDGAEFFQEDAPELVVIAQVSKNIQDIRVQGTMYAYRYFNFATATLKAATDALPEIIQNFMKGGMPISNSVTYDLTPVL